MIGQLLTNHPYKQLRAEPILSDIHPNLFSKPEIHQIFVLEFNL